MQNEGNTNEMNQGQLPLTESNTIIIVHGAWSSAQDWRDTAEHLLATGSKVVTVNLPGHGSDNTPASATSMQLYIYEVLKAIEDKKNVTIVCHSFGGIVVRAVADLIAPQIKKIIYVAAFVPQNGDSLLSIAQTDSESLIGKNLIVNEKAGVVEIVKDAVAEIFMADAPEHIATFVTEHIRPEPLAPLATPVSLSAPISPDIEEVYVHTENDRAVSHSLQQKMVKNEVLPIFKTSDRLLLIKIKQHSSKGALVFCGQCLDAFCNCNVGQIGRRLGKGLGHFSQDSDKCTFA